MSLFFSSHSESTRSFSKKAWRHLLTQDVVGLLGLLSVDNHNHKLSPYSIYIYILAMLGNEIVVSVTFLGYGGKHVVFENLIQSIWFISVFPFSLVSVFRYNSSSIFFFKFTRKYNASISNFKISYIWNNISFYHYLHLFQKLIDHQSITQLNHLSKFIKK